MFRYEVKIETTASNYGNKPAILEAKYYFDTRNEAKKHIRKMMKKHELKRHAGHIVNYRNGLELFTNF